MNPIRQDAWTSEEDALLKQTVIDHLAIGSTQTKAFEKAARRLQRTPAACQFRWNVHVRKKASEAVKAVKQEHIEAHLKEKADKPLKDAIKQLEALMKQYDQAALKKENRRLRKQVDRYEAAWAEMQKLQDWVLKEKE